MALLQIMENLQSGPNWSSPQGPEISRRLKKLWVSQGCSSATLPVQWGTREPPPQSLLTVDTGLLPPEGSDTLSLSSVFGCWYCALRAGQVGLTAKACFASRARRPAIT
ncbi:hypothetical protein MC885_018710 [Smutsia gigantea]|nr:hypothetical protein MC885_018710 [Smutsia gigantea]